ncbi:phosphotransferase family protein [Actinomadura sp. BRA 177]|uniref:phosphotransferase family protein n=1 Tax=Actinomadura sp. BRA 177 TaxID=2745202 RepID=UPI0020CC0645|nr:aminoglycoside phosphotransferase family protein [Actinomadura sp. BRA 177]
MTSTTQANEDDHHLGRWATRQDRLPRDRADLLTAAWWAGNRNVAALARAANVGRDTVYADLRSRGIDVADRDVRTAPARGMPLDYRPLARGEGAFQQPLTADEVRAVMQRVFGVGCQVMSAVELGAGMYNSTYRVEIADTEPVILRVAPEPDRQFRSERELMRNEHASVPWLSVIAPLMPRVIAADWSHEVIGRDYMVQSLLEGVPAPERLSAYPRETWGGYFRQLGEITAAVHRVRGPHFGSVAGPGHASWSQAVLASLEDIAADVENEGLDPADLRKVAAVAADHRAVLDEVTRPQLLTGDLWTVNVMLSQTASVPRISGVLDFDRTWFGDPAADWTIRMATAKDDERRAFWDGYGTLGRTSPGAVLRSQIYEARHLGSLRLERFRLGHHDAVARSYEEMAAVLSTLI